MVNQAKLEKLKRMSKVSRTGGKGSMRRKVRKVQKSSGSTAKKLSATLAKVNKQALPGVDEVNMFREDNSVLHFSRPKVEASFQANTFTVRGTSQVKTITELMPDVLHQLGPNASNFLKNLLESGALNGMTGNAALTTRMTTSPTLRATLTMLPPSK
ncbi:nascent polypeptide-associated complex subunit beta [Thecamonas trahens ATCC 50062]|uniref:Nascent polypeptide-associated complex subunit beta n=1 Tax=Thecamonas trahens ATCC 50062 TaxID=461836 RepID=A0A0L0DF98_THETB|nr:nascent polypeptide-associated complex subunit beta [Thecamonas trahens ATCC 50062]KNC49988.1 nascent polypeptide-associated complex subunit beta [Thecamonas trahens ATCC 50062]|eukprot:XP_013757157.1 nascent polypeptide-associated complex subunit beta [Thecamonas trahens ATCC 50062]